MPATTGPSSTAADPDAPGDPDAPTPGTRPGPDRTVRRVVIAVLVVAALLAAFAGGRASLAGSAPPPDDSPEAGFARDMQKHHAQAVEMAFIVRDRTTDAAVRTLAYDIATSQQHQIGQMYGWLVQWDLSQVGDPMVWMRDADEAHGGGGHAGADGIAAMPGMASAADLRRLGTLNGREAEAQFLRLMIAHHQGGVEMARAVLAQSPRREVRRLGEAVVTTQQAEVTVMQGMLDERT